jgi:hypothetical protein
MTTTSKAVAKVFSARTAQDKEVRGWYAVEKEGVNLENVRMHTMAVIMHKAYGSLHWATQNGNVIKNSPDPLMKALAYTLAYIRQEQDKIRKLAIKSGGTRMKPNDFIARLKMFGIYVDKKGTKGTAPTINQANAFVAKERAKGNGDIPKTSGAASRTPRQPAAKHSVVSKEVESITLASNLKKLLDATEHSALVEELENFIAKAKETKSAKAVKKAPTMKQAKATDPLEKAFAKATKKLKSKAKKSKAKKSKAKK